VRWRVWKKTTKLLPVFSRHISWEISQANLRVVAEEIRRAGLAVSSKFCQKYVSDRTMYKALTNKPTIDQIHVTIEKEWESSGVEMVACAMGLILVRDNSLVQLVWDVPEPG